VQRVRFNGADLEYDVQGAGEPILLIHGSILGDAFFPLLAESSLASNYRVITYHRRGFGGSVRVSAPFTIAQQAADGRALLRHLGISRAHLAGHSYGAAIALQWALDAPAEVQSLALLEPPLLASVPSGPMFGEAVAAIQAMYERGQRLEATEAFCAGVAGPDCRQLIDNNLPPGAFEQAVADIDTFFQVEVGALQEWHFTAEEAARLRQPVYAVVGAESAPVFREGHELLMRWFPQATGLVVPQATHALQFMNPGAVADGLARFFAAHPL